MSEFFVKKRNGRLEKLNLDKINKCVVRACQGILDVSASEVILDAQVQLFNKITTNEIDKALIMSARSKIEKDPGYSIVAARLLLNTIYKEVFGEGVDSDVFGMQYHKSFVTNLKELQKAGRIDKRMLTDFDLNKIAKSLVPKRDDIWKYLGIQTVYDRYLLHINGRRMETPQGFWMRVAMGLAINEENKDDKAIEFYNLLSENLFINGTPTLFNSGTNHPQLSSCYLSTVDDSIDGIFGTIHNQAKLSKFAGGLGVDWTPIRGSSSFIAGTNGKSQGLVPWLKIFNDTLVAVNQCFDPETYVFTGKEIKQIKNVQKGDFILSGNGEQCEVEDVMFYEQNDDMVEIDIKHSIDTVKVTTGHPFLAIQNIPVGINNQRTYNKFGKGIISTEWVEASLLKTGDYVAFPIPKDTIAVNNFSDDDAYLYGLMLGDGHISSNKSECGVSFNINTNQKSILWIKKYLDSKNIHYWIDTRDEYCQVRWSLNGNLPFDYEDLYNNERNKRISGKFMHLPRPQSLMIIKGLLDSDGNISRGKEIIFSNTSRLLIEGLRYQILRLGAPSAGNKRTREYDHEITRGDGSISLIKGTTVSYDLIIPAIKEIARLIGSKALTRKNWLVINNYIFSRVESVRKIDKLPIVVDLKVKRDETYTTSSGLAHNGGKRKGAGCAYLETWHTDIEDFLELRKNTGDDRRRCHDMHTANWIPDLFMRRAKEDGDWYLFSPSDCPDLHDLFGKAFDKAYISYCKKAENGDIPFKKVSAKSLWKKMLVSLFETGHPWITFKDPSNIRYSNQHVGTVRSSNLCTEILLHSKPTMYDSLGDVSEIGETAVCNLGSINLAAHVENGKINYEKLATSISIAMRMLDNVIDINFYPTKESKKSNISHRPVGLGIMGFHDTIHMLGIDYDSDMAAEESGKIQEFISYHAILNSSILAKERGKYSTYDGSLWNLGKLPQDTHEDVMNYRGSDDKIKETLDWSIVRKHISEYGMRNSNTLAIAPTATISYIAGCSQSIEPDFSVLFVYSTLSGEFTMISDFFVNDMKKSGLWGKDLTDAVKAVDGDIEMLNLPENIKKRYKTAFRISPLSLIKCAAARQVWIDQGQSLNIYADTDSLKILNDIYMYGWEKGLKTTYYLRAKSASKIEKSTSSNVSNGYLSGDKTESQTTEVKACSLEAKQRGDICEACQ